jgi:DNA-binding NarL/FixJ family response regulator
MECYSINEAAQMIQLHHPDVALLDLRNATGQQLDRSWALCHNSPQTELVVVTQSGGLQPSRIPEQISSRVTHVELEPGRAGFDAVTAAVENSG